jgi:hypothetical protein
MDFVLHYGGRAAAGYTDMTGDCVTRSIAIATGNTYQEAYDALRRYDGKSHDAPSKESVTAVHSLWSNL